MIAQATLCATSWDRQLRSCRKVWRWKLHAVTVAVTWVSSVIDESSVDTKNLQMVGHFYVLLSNSDVGRPAGFGKTLPSCEQSSDRLVWVEEEPVMSQPVLQTAGTQRQLCKIVWTGWKAGVDVDIVCALVEVNSRVTDQSTDRCHVSGV